MKQHLPEILLIEDSKDDKDLFELAFISSGTHALLTHAHDANETVMRLNRTGQYADIPLPSVIVLDLGLPGLQGNALLQVIRNAFAPQRVPVVILTGSCRDSDRIECEAMGINDYILKPTSFPELVQLIVSLRRFFPKPIEPTVMRTMKLVDGVALGGSRRPPGMH